MPRKNLVISAVGDESVHRTWLAQERERTFDLCLVYFGNESGKYAGDAEHYFALKGVKFQLIYDLAKAEPDIFQRYEYIWCPDDDVATDTRELNEFFELMRQHCLQVAQPAIHEGDAAFRALRWHPGYLLRYTRYVEIMCPAFSQWGFQMVLPTFIESMSAWGIDCVWGSMFAAHELAVIDAVGVHHTRPLQSGGVHKLFAARGINPEADFDVTIKKYGLDIRRRHRALVFDSARLQGINLAGERVWTRPWWSSVWPGERRIRARASAAA